MSQPEPYSRIPIHNRAGEVIADALVDAEDYERLAALRWTLDRRSGYARHWDGERAIPMHRHVLGLTGPRRGRVFHANGNRLDNRRANLVAGGAGLGLVTEGATVRVPLRHNRTGAVRAWAVVDIADRPKVEQHAWYLTGNGYAATRAGRGNVWMHRLILGLERDDPWQTDHIDGDKLNNRRANLRAVTCEENMQNRLANADSSSRYRGVYWHRGAWNAFINLPEKTVYLGRFADELEAARVAAAERAKRWPLDVRSQIVARDDGTDQGDNA